MKTLLYRIHRSELATALTYGLLAFVVTLAVLLAAFSAAGRCL